MTSESKHLIQFRTKLREGEQVIRNAKGSKYGSVKQGEVVLTNERVCFFRGGILGETIETIPLDKLTSVEFKSTLGVARLKLFTSNDELDLQIGNMRKEAEDFRAALELERSGNQKAGNGVDIIIQIRELADLHSLGVLTDLEFQNKKSELLSRI